MSTELERISVFEREYGWKKVLEKIITERDRRESHVRSLGKTDGRAVECAHNLGFMEGLEFVCSLPSILKTELAKTQEKHAGTR